MTERLHLALARTLAVANALAAGPLSFSALQTSVGGLAAPTLARLLRALAGAGIVSRDADGYGLGQAALRTARRIVGALGTSALVVPHLAGLAEAAGDSAAFYGWSGGVLTLLAISEVPESFHYMAIGGVVPELARHGFAQAVVACLPEAERAACWRRDPRRGEIALAAFQALCAEIRRRGVAIERGEHRGGVLRVAAAVRRGENGAVVGALGVSALSDNPAHAETAATHVLAAARAASALLRTHGGPR
jgi:DNA-binding IclR family transcriptional regulator